MPETLNTPPSDEPTRAGSLLPTALHHAWVFVLGSVVFTVIFWSVWSLFLRDMLAPTPSATPAPREQTAAPAQDELLRKYQQQAQETDQMQRDMQRQIEIHARNQKRQSELLTQQEDQTRRFEQVLRRWEAQAGLRR